MPSARQMKLFAKKALQKGKRLFKREPKLKFVYAWHYKHKKPVKNRILFESFHGKTISDSPYALLQQLLKEYPDGTYDIYYSTDDKHRKEHQAFVRENKLPVKLVSVTDYDYVEILATATYLINNSSFPAYFIKKPEQVYLQTWHGTPLKTLGKQMRKGIESMYNVQHNFLQADYIMFPNAFTKDAIMRDYNLEELYTGKVVMSGYPRNSILLDQENAGAVREQLGLQDKTVFAYMPTWRGTSNHSVQIKQFKAEMQDFLRYLDGQLTDDQRLFVNFHPMVGNVINYKNYKHIQSFPKEYDTYTFLGCTDALITDYSSVFFDYSVTKKPILLYMYDYEQYMQDRGMYMDIRELPFAQMRTKEELAAMLTSGSYKEAVYGESDYAERFTKHDAMDVPQKMLQMVLQGTMPFEVIDYAENKEKPHRVLHILNLRSKADFERIRQFAREGDIALFERKDFNIERSSILHDEYNDSFQYVFMTNTTPTTYLEWGLSRLKVGPIVRALQKRELQRTFPQLRIEIPYLEEFYVAEKGCSLRGVTSAPVRSTVRCDGERIRIAVEDPGRYLLQKVLIADPLTEILYTQDVPEDAREVVIEKNVFEELSENLMQNRNYRIVGDFEERGSGRVFLGDFCDPLADGVHVGNLIRKASDDLLQTPIPLKRVSEESAGDAQEAEDLMLVPCLYRREIIQGLSFQIRTKETALYTHFRPTIRAYRSGRTRAVIKAVLPDIPSLKVENVILKYRSVVPIRHELPFRMHKSGKNLIIRTEIDFTRYEFREIYWDLCASVVWNGLPMDAQMHYPNLLFRLRFYLGNTQYYLPDGRLIFPYYTAGRNAAFTFRNASPYDGRKTVFNEILATLCWLVTLPFYAKRTIWICYEKFSQMAQDNGYYFFRYCMESLGEEENKDIYYIIDQKADDYHKLEKYGRHVIPFMSFRHMFLLLHARILVASDSKPHVYLWRSKPSIVRWVIREKKIYFLQHGVTALKRDDHLFGKLGSSPMNYVASTSEFEQKIFLDYFGYDESEVPITGFTRWDVLEDKSSMDKKQILIMPTWRSWIEEVSNEDFLQSEYYIRYSSLINSDRLLQILEENDAKAIFYIHPKFAEYISNFHVDSERVVIIPFGQEPLNEIMMHCQALITDYSSVCWDMYYQKKPVLFYLFDLDQYNEAHGSYIDLKTELFGRQASEEETLLDLLQECIASGFALPEIDEEKFSYYFTYVDDRNSERTYDFIVAALEEED